MYFLKDDLLEFERYRVYLLKAIVAFIFFKVPVYSTEYQLQSFLFESFYVKWTKILAATPFFLGEWFKLTISQKQFQLFITYIYKCFRREFIDSRVLTFLGMAFFKRIYYKYQIFVRAAYFFQNSTCSRLFLKVTSHFISR